MRTFKTTDFGKDARNFREYATDLPYTVLDLETTIVDGSPSPFDGARPVVVGTYYKGEGHYNIYPHGDFERELKACVPQGILVGHNIKFDLIHLLRVFGGGWVMNYLTRFDAVIDTSINEYILSGQSHKFPSLDDVARSYGVAEPLKLDIKEEYFAKGLGADHIPPATLDEYLRCDLRVTGNVWEAQAARASSQQLGHFFVQGWATVVYALMEYNGLKYDARAVVDVTEEYEERVGRVEELVMRYIHAKMPAARDEHESITNRVLSTVFFGFPGLPVKRPKVVGKYKNGKPKFKVVEERVFPNTHIKPEHFFSSDVKPNPNLGWPVDESVLARLHEAIGGLTGQVAELVRRWRGDNKLLGTYLRPVREKADAVNPFVVIHPTYHQTATNTGRTSSSKPNAQNIPPEIKKLVHMKPHKVVSFDFKQLELWGAAELSGDKQMLHDVMHSDIHWETGRETMGWRHVSDMDKDSRRKIKALNFGIIYGGGVKALAAQSGVDEATVKKHMKYFRNRYPVYTGWFHRNYDDAKLSGTRNPKVESSGYVSYERELVSQTGRTYLFREALDKYSGVWVPKPSEVRNYPVQGFATGDVVPLALVRVFIYSNAQEFGVPFSAVHDSASAYIQEAYVDLYKASVTDSLRHLNADISAAYGFNPSMSPDIEWEVGDTWA
jgi:hypothetical protein